MVPFLLILNVFLMTIVYFQFQFNKTRNMQIREIQKKLRKIVHNRPTNEKILLFTDDKDLIAMVIELNQLLDKHQKATANYRKSKASMKKMISNISHDLKTPLTVTLGYIEMIQMDTMMDVKERTVLLSKVHRKTIEVIDLIQKFFDLAKLESGDKEVPVTSILINEICRKSILEYYDILKMKSFDVHIDIPDYPLYAMGNTDALERILNNLISNAIQHGGDGGTIGVTIRGDEDSVSVDIWDKGAGIIELHQDRVFERMYTLEDARNKSYQGSGLGLTITKRLVEKLGGTISVYSIPWEKTIFSFTLKRAHNKNTVL